MPNASNSLHTVSPAKFCLIRDSDLGTYWAAQHDDKLELAPGSVLCNAGLLLTRGQYQGTSNSTRHAHRRPAQGRTTVVTHGSEDRAGRPMTGTRAQQCTLQTVQANYR